ncbi:metallophosphoesterase [Pedobacter sp.]
MNYKSFVLFQISFLLFVSNSKAQINESNSYDGPYVIYKGKQILIKEANHLPNGVTVEEKLYDLKEKQKVIVKIRFSNDPKKDFEVKLKSSINPEPSVSQQPAKVLFLSDIEGEFDAFRNILLVNKVINERYEWTFGTGRLVICGDLFDRGKEVPATLWLLYKLEEQAKSKGGYVHVILGNHDIMNLAGNLKYLDPKYLLSAEAMSYPYTELYNENTELGRWLRSKNLVEKIGDNLCLHGGVSPEINSLNLSVEQINTISRPYIGWKDLKNTVKDDNILKIFNSTLGLFWYRGYFKEPAIDEAIIDETLNQHKVKRIIIGHTITKTNVGFYFGGKVLGVDVNQHENQHEAALFENGKWYKVDLTGEKKPINVY